MLTDNEFFFQSIVSNLYYLWTLRGYVARIEISLPSKYDSYIKKSQEIAKKAEILDKKVAEYAYLGLDKKIIDSEIIITPYTIDLELLTNKLFDINIDTTITDKINQVQVGNINPTKEQVQDMELINNEAKKIANEFIEFATDLYNKVNNQEVFTFFYNTINLYLIEIAKTYQESLERLKEKATINPSYVIDYQYESTLRMQAIATFIRGEIDPIYKDIFDKANDFVIEYRNIISEYENMTMTPNNQKNMTINSLELVKRLKLFVEECIKKLLKKEIYFISPPTTKDNMLTAINFFIFNLEELIKNNN